MTEVKKEILSAVSFGVLLFVLPIGGFMLALCGTPIGSGWVGTVAVVGLWIASLILLPLGLWLTYDELCCIRFRNRFRSDTVATEEEARRNCNWCGYALLAEQTNPDLCGACFKEYLECTVGGYEEGQDLQ